MMVYPVRAISRPSVLNGQANGRIDPAILVRTAGQAGGADVLLVEPAARAWRALCAAARAAGHVLKVSHEPNAYRPYDVQERIFRQRYQPGAHSPFGDYRWWNGVRWGRVTGAAAAVPGTSNHGWGLAVDTGQETDGDIGTEPIGGAALAWLVDNEERFGFSHELQSEPWHIRYFAGDHIPEAVLAFERGHHTSTTTGGFLMALTDAQQEEIYKAVTRMTPILVRKAGTTYHVSVCLLFRATGQMISLDKGSWEKSKPAIDFFKANLNQDRVISLPAVQYNTYRIVG